LSSALGTRLGGIGRWLPGLLISIVAIGLLLQMADWQELIQALRGIEIAGLVPAIIFYVLGNAFRALTWMTLLQNKAPYRRVFIVLNEGYLLNNILPFRLGELARVLLLSQSASLSPFFVLSTIIIERAYDVALAAGLLLATLPLVFGIKNASTVAITALGLVLLGLITLFLLARNREILKAKLGKAGDTHDSFRQRFINRLDSFIEGLGVLIRPGQFFLSLLFIIMSWLFGALEIHFLLNNGEAHASLWWTGFVLGVVSLGIAIPSAPAQLGVYEVAMVGALTLLGYPAGQALAVALVAHLIHIGFTGVVGTLGLIREGETVTGLYARLKNLTRLDVAR
jgi:uncharacterized protein (TIRG00374 family)